MGAGGCRQAEQGDRCVCIWRHHVGDAHWAAALGRHAADAGVQDAVPLQACQSNMLQDDPSLIMPPSLHAAQMFESLEASYCQSRFHLHVEHSQ